MSIRDFFRVLMTPSAWLQNCLYSAHWDAELNRLMEKHKFETVSQFEAKLGPITLWIENHPYCSFYPTKPDVRVRPKRITMLKAMDRYLSDAISLIEQK